MDFINGFDRNQLLMMDFESVVIWLRIKFNNLIVGNSNIFSKILNPNNLAVYFIYNMD